MKVLTEASRGMLMDAVIVGEDVLPVKGLMELNRGGLTETVIVRADFPLLNMLMVISRGGCVDANCQMTKLLLIHHFVRKYKKKSVFGLRRKYISGGYRFATTWSTLVVVGREWQTAI